MYNQPCVALQAGVSVRLIASMGLLTEMRLPGRPLNGAMCVGNREVTLVWIGRDSREWRLPWRGVRRRTQFVIADQQRRTPLNSLLCRFCFFALAARKYILSYAEASNKHLYLYHSFGLHDCLDGTRTTDKNCLWSAGTRTKIARCSSVYLLER
jgi:hypothetical protein